MTRLVGWLVLVAGSCGGTLAPAAAQARAVDTVYLFDARPGTLGSTGCEHGTAVSWIKYAPELDTLEADVVLHEAKHREQAARWGNCEDWYHAFQTDTTAAQWEAEAYSANLAALPPEKCHDRRELYVEYVYQQFRRKLPKNQVRAYFDQYGACPR